MGQPENEPDLGSTRAILEEVYEVETTQLAETFSGDKAAAAPSIPRTSPSRLVEPDVAPTPFPRRPVRANSIHHAPVASDSVLYLAYGSNLCAKTFQGRRGIRPLSRVNVSAPALRLTFDLPGLPYVEPCFANTAPREIPKPPPGMPDVPDLPDLPPFTATDIESVEVERNARGEPIWTKGLIGVVYEVTKEDYAKIVATEGGGASYHDILVPCFPLSDLKKDGLKSGLPFPEIPKPFLAHTLCAPRLPLPGGEPEDEEREEEEHVGEKKPEGPSSLPGWFKRMLLPAQRPNPDYSQASERYLGLLRDGGRENDLPLEYQAYLAALQPYKQTTLRQKIGMMMFGMSWAPIFLVLFGVSRVISDDKGKLPVWYGAVMNLQFNSLWKSYDWVFKPLFGEGERTMEDTTRRRRKSWVRSASSVPATDEEQRPLIEKGR